MPELVAKGRARIELQLRNAHFLGRFVVDHGRRDLDRRMGRPGPAPAPAAAPDEPSVPPTGEVSPVGPRAVPPAGGFAPAPADLAIPDYDTLSASQVVRRLDGLGHKELEAVYRHEAATRGRRTIIHRAQQLLGSEDPPGPLRGGRRAPGGPRRPGALRRAAGRGGRGGQPTREAGSWPRG